MKIYQLYFYVPETHVDLVKAALFEVGAGQVGNYSCTAWQTKGEGQFCPGKGSNPFLGQAGEIEKVVEYKVEMVCSADKLKIVLEVLKKVHPYETPAFGVIELLS
jgi:structural toxin protein (hemagglutinin/hemolysin) RtxA